MARVRTRPRTDGTIAYMVEWRLGGTRQGSTTSETFNTPGRAEGFAEEVEAAGHEWPRGWVRGRGYLTEPESAPPALPVRTPFLPFALDYVRDRTDVSAYMRSRYRSQAASLDRELGAIIGDTVFIESLTETHVTSWINWRRRLKVGGAPKTIANHHGLLHPIMATAVRRGMRADNPCDGHRLPKRDADDTDEVKVFLDERQWTLLLEAMHEDSRDFITVLVGTGLRFSELTALQPKDLSPDGPSGPHLKVSRAWKQVGDNPEELPRNAVIHSNGLFYLGGPKSFKGRRRLSLSAPVADALRRAAVGRQPGDFLFTAPMGGEIDRAHFARDRWDKAVAKAIGNGLTVRPRIHDLRHSHAAWLITANVPLPVIQQRLGHESIKTTVDTYGGLLVQAHDVADRAIEAALTGGTISVLPVGTHPSPCTCRHIPTE
jgi:integrase